MHLTVQIRVYISNAPTFETLVQFFNINQYI